MHSTFTQVMILYNPIIFFNSFLFLLTTKAFLYKTPTLSTTAQQKDMKNHSHLILKKLNYMRQNAYYIVIVEWRRSQLLRK